MVNTNFLQTRIRLKSDIQENWEKVPNFIPLDGEVIIYAADTTHEYARVKIGDGRTTINNLPFISANKIISNDNTNDTNIMIKTELDWGISTNASMVLPSGTILVYVGNNYSKLKIANGTTTAEMLPFVNADHINNNDIHVTNVKKQSWDNKITCNIDILNHNLIFTK